MEEHPKSSERVPIQVEMSMEMHQLFASLVRQREEEDPESMV